MVMRDVKRAKRRCQREGRIKQKESGGKETR
jgi:hypothetical protein